MLTIRVNDTEAKQIQAMAERRGKTVAEYLRWLVDRDEALILGNPGNEVGKDGSS